MAKTRRPSTATKRPWVRARPKGVVAASSAGGRRAQEMRRTAARSRRSGRMRALLPERPRPCHRGGSTIGAGRGRCATVRARVPAMAETAATTTRLAAGAPAPRAGSAARSEEHTSELQSLAYLVCRLLLEKKKNIVQVED